MKKDFYSSLSYSYTDEEFGEFCQYLADTYPDLIHLSSIGKSQQGRDIRLLTVTEFSSGEDKPGYFIQGNIHSKELSGTVVGLDLAERLAKEYVAGGVLAKCVFYFIPRCNPDGAHRCADLAGRQGERSNWGAPVTGQNLLHVQDMDGDGTTLMMRIESPDGPLMQSPDDPRGMVDRVPGANGPFYVHMLEGYLANWDGKSVPNWPDFDVEGLDWNRNWPFGWQKEQVGAGSAPLSEPEVKIQSDWLIAHPNIVAAISLHNGYASALLPTPQPQDVDYFRHLAELAEKFVKVPALDQNFHGASDAQVTQHGQFTDYCYRMLNFVCVTFELGTRENSAGADSRELYQRKNTYTNPVEVLAQQDAHPELPVCFHAWRQFNHPQLGQVEIGGLHDTLFANPLPDYLKERANGVYKFMLANLDELLARN